MITVSNMKHNKSPDKIQNIENNLHHSLWESLFGVVENRQSNIPKKNSSSSPVQNREFYMIGLEDSSRVSKDDLSAKKTRKIQGCDLDEIPAHKKLNCRQASIDKRAERKQRNKYEKLDFRNEPKSSKISSDKGTVKVINEAHISENAKKKKKSIDSPKEDLNKSSRVSFNFNQLPENSQKRSEIIAHVLQRVECLEKKMKEDKMKKMSITEQNIKQISKKVSSDGNTNDSSSLKTLFGPGSSNSNVGSVMCQYSSIRQLYYNNKNRNEKSRLDLLKKQQLNCSNKIKTDRSETKSDEYENKNVCKMVITTKKDAEKFMNSVRMSNRQPTTKIIEQKSNNMATHSDTCVCSFGVEYDEFRNTFEESFLINTLSKLMVNVDSLNNDGTKVNELTTLLKSLDITKLKAFSHDLQEQLRNDSSSEKVEMKNVDSNNDSTDRRESTVHIPSGDIEAYGPAKRSSESDQRTIKICSAPEQRQSKRSNSRILSSSQLSPPSSLSSSSAPPLTTDSRKSESILNINKSLSFPEKSNQSQSDVSESLKDFNKLGRDSSVQTEDEFLLQECQLREDGDGLEKPKATKYIISANYQSFSTIPVIERSLGNIFKERNYIPASQRKFESYSSSKLKLINLPSNEHFAVCCKIVFQFDFLLLCNSFVSTIATSNAVDEFEQTTFSNETDKDSVQETTDEEYFKDTDNLSVKGDSGNTSDTLESFNNTDEQEADEQEADSGGSQEQQFADSSDQENFLHFGSTIPCPVYVVVLNASERNLMKTKAVAMCQVESSKLDKTFTEEINKAERIVLFEEGQPLGKPQKDDAPKTKKSVTICLDEDKRFGKSPDKPTRASQSTTHRAIKKSNTACLGYPRVESKSSRPNVTINRDRINSGANKNRSKNNVRNELPPQSKIRDGASEKTENDTNKLDSQLEAACNEVLRIWSLKKMSK